jgi:hypothetical protein
MVRNGKRPGAGKSTSFRRDEIEAMCQLFDILYRGGAPDTVLRSDGVVTSYAKFKKMRAKLREEAGK